MRNRVRERVGYRAAPAFSEANINHALDFKTDVACSRGKIDC